MGKVVIILMEEDEMMMTTTMGHLLLNACSNEAADLKHKYSCEKARQDILNAMSAPKLNSVSNILSQKLGLKCIHLMALLL
mmetsp:Transcript_6583/g.13866  ORF Transcript_6583/g.13866 Transcript_6583/m.13866 type:complete len:81 (-) Transcript_6583:103-345(-)